MNRPAPEFPPEEKKTPCKSSQALCYIHSEGIKMLAIHLLSPLTGTVLDDISKNRTCVPVEQCPCTLNGEMYAPGDVMKATCRTW